MVKFVHTYVYIYIYTYLFFTRNKNNVYIDKIPAKVFMNIVTRLAPLCPPSWFTTHEPDITLCGKLFSKRQLSNGVSISSTERIEPECVYI